MDLFDLYNQTDLKNNGVFDDGGCTQQLSTEDNNVLAFFSYYLYSSRSFVNT